MTTSICGASATSSLHSAQPTQQVHAKPAATKPAAAPEDSVHLSAAAKAAAKAAADPDHDGD